MHVHAQICEKTDKKTYWYYCIASISCHMAIRQCHKAHLISCMSPNL